MKRGARVMLGGQLDFHVPGANLFHSLMNDAMRQFRTVALAAEVSQVEMAKVGRHDFLGGVGGVLVGQMTMPPGDALLEAPGTAGVLQHLEIMIGFQHEHVGLANALEHEFGGMAEVGHKPNIARRGAEQETDRIRGIVRNAESIDDDVTEFKAAAGAEDAAIEPRLKLEFDGLFGEPIAIDRNVELGTQADQTVDVIRVFVGDQDAGQTLRNLADRSEALARLPDAETSIDQQPGFSAFQVGAIAAGTAAQNGELYSHERTLVCGDTPGNAFVRHPAIVCSMPEAEEPHHVNMEVKYPSISADDLATRIRVDSWQSVDPHRRRLWYLAGGKRFGAVKSGAMGKPFDWKRAIKWQILTP